MNSINNVAFKNFVFEENLHNGVRIHKGENNLIAFNSAPKRRGTGILYKIGSQVKNPQTITCYNNMTINCNYGIEVVTTGNPTTNVFDNNVTVNCTQPITYKIVTDKARDTAATAITNGTNIIYNNDPGFVNMKSYNFNLKPDSKIFKDLPSFKPLPINKMGLFIDEYRKTLPSDVSVNRFVNIKSKNGYDGTDILDRQ